MVVVNNTDEIDFHAAGADRDLRIKPLSNADKLYLWYRFRIEDRITSYLVKKYCNDYKYALDCGAGTGRFSVLFSKHFDFVDSFDLSSTFKDAFREHFNYINNVNFIVSNFETYNSDKKYDLIFVGGVFMCMSDNEVKLALDKIKKWIKPNGVMICRDTLAKENTQNIDQTKKYRTEKEYMSFFGNYFSAVEIMNGANRNYTYSLFIRLPKSMQENFLFFYAFKVIISATLPVNFFFLRIRGNRHHHLASQRFYALKPDTV